MPFAIHSVWVCGREGKKLKHHHSCFSYIFFRCTLGLCVHSYCRRSVFTNKPRQRWKNILKNSAIYIEIAGNDELCGE
jgi:hypothetical protein